MKRQCAISFKLVPFKLKYKIPITPWGKQLHRKYYPRKSNYILLKVRRETSIKLCYTSFLKILNASPTYGTQSSGTNSLTLATSSAVCKGSNMTGPLPFMMSNGIFMPERGVRMSENRMTCHDNFKDKLYSKSVHTNIIESKLKRHLTPSGLKTSQGCNEISTTRSTFSDLSRNDGCFSQMA